MSDETRQHPLRPERTPADRSKVRDPVPFDRDAREKEKTIDRKPREVRTDHDPGVEDDVSPMYGPLH